MTHPADCGVCEPPELAGLSAVVAVAVVSPNIVGSSLAGISVIAVAVVTAAASTVVGIADVEIAEVVAARVVKPMLLVAPGADDGAIVVVVAAGVGTGVVAGVGLGVVSGGAGGLGVGQVHTFLMHRQPVFRLAFVWWISHTPPSPTAFAMQLLRTQAHVTHPTVAPPGNKQFGAAGHTAFTPHTSADRQTSKQIIFFFVFVCLADNLFKV